ncbi:hypothetical protein TNCV_3464181 [Trichonephila clavipes]|nr:hypothetical protein TNCV_3464181 [Trichonephila clavipes]
MSSLGRQVRLSHFRRRQCTMNINRYTNAVLAGIHFIYGLANGNGCVAVRLATIDDTPIHSEMDLVERVSIDYATIHEMPEKECSNLVVTQSSPICMVVVNYGPEWVERSHAQIPRGLSGRKPMQRILPQS